VAQLDSCGARRIGHVGILPCGRAEKNLFTLEPDFDVWNRSVCCTYLARRRLVAKKLDVSLCEMMVRTV
jgi:hypothetical protein